MKNIILVLMTVVMLLSVFTLAVSAEGEAADESIVDVNFDWHPENAVNNLQYMGLGMLGIFVIIGIVMAITYVLNSVTGKKK